VKLRITLEGQTYDVEVEQVEEPAAPPAALPPLPRRPIATPLPPYAKGRRVPKSDEHTCRSPIGGVVASLAVTVGQAVEKHDLLVVIEAMKMETKLFALGAGRVTVIRAAVGDAVKLGQVLIELE
jgi:biotin carboxyl carrier protein